MSDFTSPTAQKGFALPTLLIVSIVMLTILLSSIGAVSTSRGALNDQYYTQLAREAAESGLARANSCLKLSNYVATWGTKSLFPNTGCTGGDACTNAANCFLLSDGNTRTTFEVHAPIVHGATQAVAITGTVQILRTSDGAVWRTYTYSSNGKINTDLSFNTVAFGYQDQSSAGAYFATIASDGSVKMVGNNTYGQLSNGTTTSTLTPTPFILPVGFQPVSVFTNFLSQGMNMFVIASNGLVYGAGLNDKGQLGDGTTTNRSTAVAYQLPAGKQGWYVGVNGRSTFVLTQDGTLYSTGDCGSGQLGTNYTISGCSSRTTYGTVALPAYVSGDLNTHPTPNMSLDAATIYIRMEGGRVYGWGSNKYGQLATGNTTDSSVPVKIGTYGDSGQPKAVSMAFDGDTIYVVDDTGAIKCAGRNTYGELGNGTTTNSNTMQSFNLPPSAGKAIKVTTDQWFASVLTDSGQVWSAGLNDAGQLGNGAKATTQSTPVRFILPTGVTATDIYTASTGVGSAYSNTFVIGSNGKVYGAGKNSFGQLGDGTTTDRSTPVAMQVIDGTTIKAQQIQAGLGTAVILTTNRKVYTVGNNNNGQLGDGTTTNSSVPYANQYTNVIPVLIY